jgi:hypothetical protein
MVDPTNRSRWPGPFTPLPLQEPQRYYEPVRQPALHRYSAPHSFCCSVISLSPPPRADVSGRAFPRSVQPQQTRLASPSCRTPPGQSAGTRQAHPGDNLKPRFRCRVVNHLDTSSAIHFRSPSRSPPDTSPVPFPHRSPPRPHDRRSMRRFEASPRRATPKGQPSSAAQHRLRPRLPTHRDLQRSWHTRFRSLLFSRVP